HHALPAWARPVFLRPASRDQYCRRRIPLAVGATADRAARHVLPFGVHGPAVLDARRDARSGLAPGRRRHRRGHACPDVQRRLLAHRRSGPRARDVAAPRPGDRRHVRLATGPKTVEPTAERSSSAAAWRPPEAAWAGTISSSATLQN